jgi:hypothetical protein
VANVEAAEAKDNVVERGEVEKEKRQHLRIATIATNGHCRFAS